MFKLRMTRKALGSLVSEPPFVECLAQTAAIAAPT
jgi:hypothetical protein